MPLGATGASVDLARAQAAGQDLHRSEPALESAERTRVDSPSRAPTTNPREPRARPATGLAWFALALALGALFGWWGAHGPWS